MDHDQRFKTLIRSFFADFLRLFFNEWAERFDLTLVEWIDKEVLPNPPEGSRHLLDLIARLPARQQVADIHSDEPRLWMALIHIEIESPDRAARLKPRLPGYYVHLRDQYELPVLPIVIYLKVGLDGIGVDIYEERFWELSTLRFSYLYVGLPGLDAVQYVQGDNWLGVALAALMRIPPERVAWLGAEALKRLTQAPLSEQQKFLLADCVEAYLPLDDEQREQYEALLLGNSNLGVKAVNQTSFEKGIEQGIEKGIEKGVQNTLLRLGRKRFGAISDDIESRIRSISDINRLEMMAERVMDVNSWNELLQTS